MLDKSNPLGYMTAGLCKTRGCFLQKAKAKIEVFANCFPRNIAMSDVDGITEIGGRFLFLEWESTDGFQSSKRQIARVLTTKIEDSIVFIGHGDPETMVLRWFSFYWRDKSFRHEPAEIEMLKAYIKEWARCAETRISMLDSPLYKAEKEWRYNPGEIL